MTITPKMLLNDLVIDLGHPIKFNDQVFESISEMVDRNQNDDNYNEVLDTIFEFTRCIGRDDVIDPTTYDINILNSLCHSSPDELKELADSTTLYLMELFDSGYVLTDKNALAIAKLFSMLPQEYAVQTFWNDLFSTFNGVEGLLNTYSRMLHRWVAPQLLRVFKVEPGTRGIGMKPVVPDWFPREQIEE